MLKKCLSAWCPCHVSAHLDIWFALRKKICSKLCKTVNFFIDPNFFPRARQKFKCAQICWSQASFINFFSFLNLFIFWRICCSLPKCSVLFWCKILQKNWLVFSTGDFLLLCKNCYLRNMHAYLCNKLFLWNFHLNDANKFSLLLCSYIQRIDRNKMASNRTLT